MSIGPRSINEKWDELLKKLHRRDADCINLASKIRMQLGLWRDALNLTFGVRAEAKAKLAASGLNVA
eukprot:6487021-Lingulodinium_polyedra.AAC.1